MIFFIVTGILIAIAMLIFYIKSGHFFKNFFKSFMLGAIAFLITLFFGQKIGITMPVNILSISTTALLGLPGVALILVTQYIL